MNPTPRVVVIGDLVTDVVAHLAETLTTGSDTPATISTTGGGAGANVAAWLAEAGIDTAFVGRVGADNDGELRMKELAELGVRLAVGTDASATTGTVVVLVAPNGERTMVPDRGANLNLLPAHVPADVFSPGAHLHLSGYTLFDPGPRIAALHALRLAREAGMTVSVDPSSSQPLRTVGPARFLDWTAGVDLCLPNLEEAGVLSGTLRVDEAARRLTTRYPEVVVTMGEQGAVYADVMRQLRCGAAATPVVDTTGAGDAFTAGFLRARLAGEPVEQQLRSGAALAARAVATVGARPKGSPSG
ncbi:MAG: hypothetical protein GEU74_00345 [Nitriliruptorales bacterium]|nr:hypothetical protein [Nitriliruptorales bacterium]